MICVCFEHLRQNIEHCLEVRSVRLLKSSRSLDRLLDLNLYYCKPTTHNQLLFHLCDRITHLNDNAVTGELREAL